MPLGLIGAGHFGSVITLNYSSSNAFFTIDSNLLDNLTFMNFFFGNIVVDNTTEGTAPFFNVDFSSATTAGQNVFEMSDFIFGNPVGQIAINAVGFQDIYIKALQNYGSSLNLNALTIEAFGYGNGGLYVSGKTVNLYGLPGFIAGNTSLVAIDGSWQTGYITIGPCNGNGSTTPITIGTLIVKDMLVAGGFNQAFLINSLNATATINNLIIKNVTAYNLSSNANFISNPFGGNVVINYADIEGIYSNNNYYWVNIPFNSTTNGTTAGTVVIQSKTYRPDYKKYIITFNGYENNTTTNQTINYPKPFASYAVITANNTGLTITPSTTGITITSPNSTTTYSGIVIVEGY
jgi:hypothetical protein